MKANVLAALLGSAAAVALNDAPHYFNEPTWGQTWPSAAGLVQLTSCEQFGGMGVSCGPADVELFANGMDGDEDLKTDIIMKGNKYHYAQGQAQQAWTPVVVKTTGALPVCHGNNGPDGVNCVREACSGTNGPKDGPTGTPCTREEATVDKTAPSQQVGTTGNITPQHPAENAAAAPAAAAAAPAAAKAAAAAKPALYQYIQLDEEKEGEGKRYEEMPAEKVLVPQTTWARHHTTYY